MGYYTKYELEFKTDTRIPACEHAKPEGASFCPTCGIAVREISLRESIIKVIRKNEEMVWALGEDGSCGEPCKWYEHVQDMESLSQEFPSVMFVLRGEGEESGDLWREYWLGGLVQRVVAKIIFDRFDKSKLVRASKMDQSR